MAFSQVEPFGAEADYLGHAITASTVANVNRKPKSKALPVEDFMPKFEKKKKKQSTSEMIQIASMFTAASGGTDKR